jgi:hypothetical protein
MYMAPTLITSAVTMYNRPFQRWSCRARVRICGVSENGPFGEMAEPKKI